ncbi:hypothetical protein Tco_1248206 [Tanacetum coccineum]
MVKTFVDSHTCLQSRDIKKCTAIFLAKEVEDTIIPNPSIPTTALRDQLQKKYQLGFSKMKVYRAKKIAKEKIVQEDISVGVNCNNGTYPVAYAMVEAETKDVWMWFLDYLGDDLDFTSESNFTFISDRQKVIAKCDGPLTPNATKLFNVIKEKAAQYKVEWNRDDKYQVTRPRGDQCVVTMSIKVYTCKRWELTGIPYKHAVAAINDMWNNGMINPVNGKQYWPKSFVPIELIPPKHHPQVGRTPKKRKKSAMEVEEMMKHRKFTRARKTVRKQEKETAAQGKSSSQPPLVSSPARPSQGIVIRDSPSANTRSSRLQVSS